jgi:hypothetical protein
MSRQRAWYAAVALVAGFLALVYLVGGQRSAGSRRVGSAGVSVVLPPGWHDLPQAVPPAGMRVGDPLTRIVVASSPIDFAARGCNESTYAFSASAVAVVLVEWVRPAPGRLPSRPRHITPADLPVRPPPALECWDGPGGAIQFEDQGRRFETFVLLGRRAPAGLAEHARRVLDTLEVR